MEQKKTDYTKIIAIYGAVVSSVALIWAISSDVWKETTNEGKLKIDIIGCESDLNGNEAFDMKIRVVNEGKRPIVLMDWGIKKIEENGSSETLTYGSRYNLPVRLEEKQLYVFDFKTSGPTYADHYLLTKATEIFFVDSIGERTVVFPDEIEWWECSTWNVNIEAPDSE